MLAQNATAERLDLAVKAQFEACPLKAEVESANAGKERCDGVGQFQFLVGANRESPYVGGVYRVAADAETEFSQTSQFGSRQGKLVVA